MSPRSVVACLLLAGVVSCAEEGAPGEIAVYVAGTGGTGGAGGTGAVPGGVAPLAARIEVTGNHAACGSCDSLVAVVTGGTPPYTYEWSDPTLAGPGPHGVCPRNDVRYAVVVKDSTSALVTGQPQNALGTASLECTTAPSDAGAGGGLNGCIVIPQADPVTCTTNDGAGSTRIEFDVEPGRTYQYTYTQLLPIGLGVASTVDVYLGMIPCERAQKAFTLQLDSTVTQSHCFTPNASYQYSTTVVHVNGIPLTFGVTATFCDSCTSPSSP